MELEEQVNHAVLSLDDEQEALYRWCSSVGLSRVH